MSDTFTLWERDEEGVFHPVEMPLAVLEDEDDDIPSERACGD